MMRKQLNSMEKTSKIHYNPYADIFPIDKRLPKTICNQKNYGTNETHIKENVTCGVCKKYFKRVDEFVQNGVHKVLKGMEEINSMSFEELEDFEYRHVHGIDDIPETKKERKRWEQEQNEKWIEFLRDAFGCGDEGGDVYLTDGLVLTESGEIIDEDPER